MSYSCELGNGQLLLVENEGDNTSVSLGSDGGSQRQSQGTGFSTGKWSKTPSLFRVGKDFVLRIQTGDGARFVRVRGNEIRQLKEEPDMANAEKLRLKKSDQPVGMKPMEPMKPMAPMKPMKPMEPMKPMKPMRPMEMRMGGMSMSMGSVRTAPAKRFCTQCGAPADEGDRFCGSCGCQLGEKRG